MPFPRPATIGTGLRDRAVGLRAALTDAGVPASLEPGETPVPGAWISVRTAELSALGETWAVRFHVYLIAPDVSVLAALDVLGDLLNRALTVLAPDEPVNAATSIALPHTPSQPLPAFLLVVDELIDNDEGE